MTQQNDSDVEMNTMDEPMPAMPPKKQVKKRDDEIVSASKMAAVPKFKEGDRWGVAVLREGQMIRESPVSVNVNGNKAYFPYEKPVLAQEKYVEALRNSYYEGHRVIKDSQGKERLVFRPARHSIEYQLLDPEYQNAAGLKRFVQENDGIILAEHAIGVR